MKLFFFFKVRLKCKVGISWISTPITDLQSHDSTVTSSKIPSTYPWWRSFEVGIEYLTTLGVVKVQCLCFLTWVNTIFHQGLFCAESLSTKTLQKNQQPNGSNSYSGVRKSVQACARKCMFLRLLTGVYDTVSTKPDLSISSLLPASNWVSVTTAQLNILTKSLCLSHRISSFCSHISQRTSEMLFFISLALLEISLGQFVDFSLHIEFDNLTARCWRQDHLLINLGQTAISSLFFLPNSARLSSNTVKKNHPKQHRQNHNRV